MRKLCVALAIALLCALWPAGSVAEKVGVEVTQVSDPILYYDGEPFLNLSGLTLQMTAGSTADGALAQYIIDLYADGENINSMILQESEGYLCFFIGGMQRAYAVSAEELGITSTGNDDLENFDFDAWALPDAVEEKLIEFMTKNIDAAGAREVEVELSTGKVIMSEVSFAGDCTELFREIAELADADALLGALAASMEIDGYADALDDMDFRAELEGTIAHTADGASTRVALTLKTVQDGEETAHSLRLLLDGSAGSAQLFDMRYVMIDKSSTETAHATGTVDGDALDLTATVIYDEDEDYFDSLTNIRFKVTPGMDSASGKDSFWLEIDMPYDEMKITASGDQIERTGEVNVVIGAKDSYSDVELYFSYLPDKILADGAASSGTIEFGGSDGYTDFKLTCAVRTFETTIDTEDFYIDREKAGDISNMSDVEGQAMLNELERVLFDTIEKLEEAVPGLTGLTDSIFGYTYDEMF